MPLYTQGRTLERWAQITCEADIFCHMENMEDLVVPSLPACSWVKSHSQPMDPWYDFRDVGMIIHQTRDGRLDGLIHSHFAEVLPRWRAGMGDSARDHSRALRSFCPAEAKMSLPKNGAYCTPVSDKLILTFPATPFDKSSCDPLPHGDVTYALKQTEGAQMRKYRCLKIFIL